MRFEYNAAWFECAKRSDSFVMLSSPLTDEQKMIATGRLPPVTAPRLGVRYRGS